MSRRSRCGVDAGATSPLLEVSHHFFASSADRRDRLPDELAALNEKLRAAPVRESVDPQSEALAQALAFAGLAANPRDVGYGLAAMPFRRGRN